MFISIALAALIRLDFNFLLILSYWLLVSPLPLYLGHSMKNHPDLLRIAKPVDTSAILTGIDRFITRAGRDQRILMCFDNPQNTYEKLFDGYRQLIEPIHYVANTNKIHFMPDFWGVFELNYEGAKDFWGRDIASVKKNIQSWNADFIIIYQESGTDLDDCWKEEQFEVCASIDWQEFHEENKLDKFYTPPVPKWWLLKVPDQLKS
jgi:hypothetical protein